jgi:hypothetical protein
MMTTTQALWLAGAVALGYYWGCNVQAKMTASGSTGTLAHNDVNNADDWWTYAGSWGS